MKLSLINKLNISFLAVILIFAAISAIVGMQLIITGIFNQVQDTVRNNLNVASEIYNQEETRIKDVVRFTSQRFFLREEILNDNKEAIQKELEKISQTESLDILTLTDNNGIVIARSSGLPTVDDNQANDQILKQVLLQKKSIAGTIVLSEAQLKQEDEGLRQRARIIVPPSGQSNQQSSAIMVCGMCIKAASPVFDDNSQLIGILYGANLLSRNFQLVDKIKETVYKDVTYKGADIGVATIFQGDIRIASNVLDENSNRAIGTSLSKQIYERVFIKGELWPDKSFVLNKWYITTYEPIKDTSGQVVGILGVGVQEQRFIDMRNRAAAIFLGIIFCGMITAMVISRFLAHSILRPIEDLTYASDQWAKGNLDYHIKIRKTDEISQLGEMFNQMASSLKERNEKLQEYTDQQMMRSERLATLGQLAAGVAHEINNPLGAILMYSHLSLEDMQETNILSKNLEKTIAEASRCRDIVKGLLDFSRQTEPKVEQADINNILERTLTVVKDQSLFRNIEIIRQLAVNIPKISVDIGQIQQVFTNIVLNAGDSMNGKGRLTVKTYLSPDKKYISIEFADTGHGIEEQNLEKIFEPFFTTKEVGKGTGLGLAVSYGIITRHKGTIEVKSKPGKGAAFIVSLPV
jgi:two-component system, NtrC family, sensor kinase